MSIDQQTQGTTIVAETNVVPPAGLQTEVESSPKAVPKPSRGKLTWQIIGIVLAVAAGFLSNRLWGWDIYYPGSVDFYMLLGIGIFVLVGSGAFLLRSWWALLIVPAAWLVGEILGDTLIPLILISMCALTVNCGE